MKREDAGSNPVASYTEFLVVRWWYCLADQPINSNKFHEKFPDFTESGVNDYGRV